MRKITLVIICLLPLIGLKAQEKALLYSHYAFNGLALNPAYSGSHEMLSVNLSHRSQWMGFEGAPTYNIFAAHTPLKKTAMGLGLLVMNESIGLRRYTGFYMNYAHRLNLGSGKLALGLKAGLATGKMDVSSLDGNDDVFNSSASSYLLPNFGLGMYYYSRNFYAGLSVPLLLGYKTSESGKVAVYHDFKQYAWYFTTGVKIKIADLWVLQPSAMLEYEIPSGLIADAGVTIIYKDLLGVGCTYRSKQALVMLMDFKLNYQLHVGLAYDYGMNGINEYNRNSFEIILEYNFGFQVKASNPTLF